MLLMDERAFQMQFGTGELARLRRLGAVGDPQWASGLESAAAQARLAEVEVLLTSWGAPALTGDVLAAAPRLRAVLHCAGSVRGVVTNAVWERGVLVTSAAEVNARPVAEFTLAAIVLAAKKAPFLAADARRIRDNGPHVTGRGERSNLGRTIGIVGFSRTGRQVVGRLRGLDTAEVLVADPYADRRDVAASGARLVGLDELVSASDICSLHLPALPETRHTIGAAELAAMPDGATLINTARGSVVDTDALAEACVTGRINAILDVTDPEPLPADSVLYDLPNVMITPHLAGSLDSETRRMTAAALDELERYGKGLGPVYPVSQAEMRLSA
jgi:phosphoglycerate dehydrogenase-like enzyme